MDKLSAVFDIGDELRRFRKKAGLTQPELAEAANIAERTVRTVENGQGTIASWNAVLDALNISLEGRNLPSGETLGERLRVLRRRRKLSQAALAELVGVTKPTIGSLERDGVGRIATLQGVLAVLGAGAYLASRNAEKAFYTHAGNSSTDQSWETPAELLEALYRVFPKFDLDPCAPRQSRPTLKARVRYTAEDDGLSLHWHGAVFMNPPYGRTLSRWIAKARQEVESGRARVVVALIPARPDTSYWHEHIAEKAAVYFLRGRLRFGNCEQSAPFPSALAIWGADSEMLTRLDTALPNAWRAG